MACTRSANILFSPLLGVLSLFEVPYKWWIVPETLGIFCEIYTSSNKSILFLMNLY